jgi:hypothetical protein
MPYRPALAVFASQTAEKTLERPVSGRDKWLQKGTHDVKVEGIEFVGDDNKFFVTFSDANGASIRDRFFITNMEGNEPSWKLKRLLAALIPSKEAIDTFYKLAGAESTYDKAFQSFRGMKLRITVEPGEGYERFASGGKVGLRNAVTGEILTELHEEVAEAEAELQEKYPGLGRSFKNVTKTSEIDAETSAANVAAFKNAVASLTSTPVKPVTKFKSSFQN